MRIVCPDCGARLRIDTARIRAETARIKCSKCSTTFAADLSPPDASHSPTGSCHPSAILIVDDARFFREMLTDVLKPLAARLLTACDGIEALEIFRRERPVVVILDLNLPGMDGFELIRRFRDESAPGALRLLAMSAVFRSESDISAAEAAGADAFFPKSFRPEQLLAEVRRLLERA